MNDLQRKATKQKIKNIIKASGIRQSKQKHIGCSPVQFAFQSSRVCAFCFWIFKINFLSFWSREENLCLETGERSSFMVMLSGSMAGWRWAQEGSRGTGTGRALPLLSSLSMAGRARGRSRACQQPWLPRGDGLGPGFPPGDGAGTGNKALVWVCTPLETKSRAQAADKAEVYKGVLSPGQGRLGAVRAG